MPSRYVTDFGKSMLIGVKYKPLLPAFVTINYYLLLATDGFSFVDIPNTTYKLTIV